MGDDAETRSCTGLQGMEAEYTGSDAMCVASMVVYQQLLMCNTLNKRIINDDRDIIRKNSLL